MRHWTFIWIKWTAHVVYRRDVMVDLLKILTGKNLVFVQGSSLFDLLKNELRNFLKVKLWITSVGKHFVVFFVMDDNEYIGITLGLYLLSSPYKTSLFDVKQLALLGWVGCLWCWLHHSECSLSLEGLKLRILKWKYLIIKIAKSSEVMN